MRSMWSFRVAAVAFALVTASLVSFPTLSTTGAGLSSTPAASVHRALKGDRLPTAKPTAWQHEFRPPVAPLQSRARVPVGANCRPGLPAQRGSCGPWERSTRPRAVRAGPGVPRACVRRSVSCRSGDRPGASAGPGRVRATGRVVVPDHSTGLALVICHVAGLRGAEQVHGGRAAVCVPSLRRCRKEDSILDSCCSLSYVRSPAGRGAPTLVNCTGSPRIRTFPREIGSAAVGIVYEIDSATSVRRLEPLARGTPAREVRRWRTFLSYSALPYKRKPSKLLIPLMTHFRQPEISRAVDS